MDPQDNQQEQQQGQKSSVERADDLVNKARNIKKARRRLRVVQYAVRIGTQIARTSVMGWAIVGTFIFVIGATFLISILGGGGATQAGTPEEEPGPGVQACADVGGTCKPDDCTAGEDLEPDASCEITTDRCCVPKAPPGSPGDIKECSRDYHDDPDFCLMEIFKTRVNGQTTKDQRAEIYHILASTKSERYRKLLTNGPTLTIYITDICGKSFGVGDIKLNGFFVCGKTAKGRRYLLLHESGHIIYWRNQQMANTFPLGTYANGADSSCYEYHSTNKCADGYFLQSYVLRYYCPAFEEYYGCYDISNFRESFAEAIADYVFSDRAEATSACAKPIYNYQTNCSKTFEWAKEHIYGGVLP